MRKTHETNGMGRRRVVLLPLLMWSSMIQASEPPTTAPADVPVIRLWLDAPVDEVAGSSTYRLPPEFLKGIPGKEIVAGPHVLLVDEPGFVLRFNVAGIAPSLATRISYSVRHVASDPTSFIQSFVVHPLPDYVRLDVALAKAKELRQMLLAQDFKEEARSVKDRFTAEWEAAPAGADRFEGLEAAFLSSKFFAKSGSAFSMTKGRNLVNLRLVNGRRKWGSREDRSDLTYLPVAERIRREVERMSESDLRSEAVYSLEFSVGPTIEWQDKRTVMPRTKLK